MAESFSIHVDITEVTAMLQKAGADMPAFIDELENELALEAKATEQELVPVATHRWTPETVIGELRRSVDIIDQKEGYLIGPTAMHRGYPYGVAVKRGTAWGGRPAQIGPRPFDEWTMAELKLKVDPMMEKITEKHMREWS